MAPEVLAILTEVWSTSSDPAITDLVLGGASAGDVNGDGYGDLLVLEYATAGVPGASVRLHLGSNVGVSSTADAIGSIDAWIDAYDNTVVAAPAGDVNGDGFDDVILALPYANYPASGVAIVSLGSAGGLDFAPAWSDQAVFVGGLARSIAGAGDVNGDGYDDVIIGSWDDAGVGGSHFGGTTRVYLGSPSGLSPTPAWSASGQQERDAFGTAVASAGDVNGDGFDDVAVGASCDNDVNSGGHVDVFLGSVSGLSPTPDWTTGVAMTEPGHCNQLGNNVASAGDVNGDGFDDLVVGAPGEGRYGDSVRREGTASVFHGSAAGLAATPSWVEIGDQLGGALGRAVASAGDVDGDGYDDVLIGAMYQYGDTVLDGRAYLYRGGPAGLGAGPAWVDSGDQTAAYFGSALGSAGDVDGDDLDDVWVFALAHDEPDGTTGRVALYRGGDACVSGPDTDGDTIIDTCDLCLGEDLSGDADGDGWCARDLDGRVADCDDADGEIFPGAPEACDGVNNDCHDGLPDDEEDLDGDGVYPCGGDCDDADPLSHPYTEEVCGDGLDNNCDGVVDEGCSSPRDGGCDCATSGPTSAWAVFTLWAVLLTRRRN